MKDNQNIINVLLVVAIVLAVGGTWMNLNKLNDVKDITLTGYSVAGTAITPGIESLDVGTLDYNDVITSAGSTSIDGLDCYWSTDSTQPGTDPTPCNIVSSNATAATWALNTNGARNGSVYVLYTITQQYGSGTLNNNFIKVANCTNGTLNQVNGGTVQNVGSWQNVNTATSGSKILVVENANNQTLGPFNCSIEWGQEIDIGTAQGNYNNSLYFILHSP